MSDKKLREVVPVVEYRALMRNLSSLLSRSEDIYELKYMLKSLIPAGKREGLNIALQVFDFLENLELLGPTKFYWLHGLFQEMEKPDLRAMVLNFILEHEEETYI